MKLCDYCGYEIHIPTSGGKAGSGYNITSTIQIRTCNSIARQIRFTVSSLESRSTAIQKAKDWIAVHPLSAPDRKA